MLKRSLSFVLFLSLALGLTWQGGASPGFAAKKKSSASKVGGGELEKTLEPFNESLNTLRAKSNARLLYSADDSSQLASLYDDLLGMMVDYPAHPLLLKPVFQLAQLLERREASMKAYQAYLYLVDNYPASPYAFQSKAELYRLKTELQSQLPPEATPDPPAKETEADTPSAKP